MSIVEATPGQREAEFDRLLPGLYALIEGETDPITLMASIACELFHGIESYHWVGFYRVVAPRLLKVGPYQGGHGCLVIPFDQGICGRCAETGQTENIPDVTADPRHIACSSTTRSELVLPVWGASGELLAVLDIDSDLPNNFSAVDEQHLRPLLDVFRYATP